MQSDYVQIDGLSYRRGWVAAFRLATPEVRRELMGVYDGWAGRERIRLLEAVLLAAKRWIDTEDASADTGDIAARYHNIEFSTNLGEIHLEAEMALRNAVKALNDWESQQSQIRRMMEESQEKQNG